MKSKEFWNNQDASGAGDYRMVLVLAAVSNPGDLPFEKTLFDVFLLKDEVRVALSTLTEEQLKIESPHRNFAKFGNKPVSFMIGHFIDEHLAGHHGQIQRNLSKLVEV